MVTRIKIAYNALQFFTLQHPRQMSLRLFRSDADVVEAGCDEVGRGALAGPVVAAAVIWGREESQFQDDAWRQIKDSKRLTPNARARLADYIKDTAIDYAIGSASSEEIDRDNILRATFAAMHRALDGLVVDFDAIIVDGDRFKQYMRLGASGFVPHECIVEGDNKYVAIAAASILAKVARDDLMQDLHHGHPAYDWWSNKGYGTAAHMYAIAREGHTPHHRLTFLKRADCDAASSPRSARSPRRIVL